MQKRNMVLFALIVTIICIGMSTISAADMADVNATAIASENAIDDVATIEDTPEQDIEVVTSEQNNLGNEFYTNENSLGMVEDSPSDDLQSTTRTSVTVSNWADLKTYCEQTSDYEITLSDGIYTPTGEIIVKNNVVINGNSNAVIGGTASNPCSVDYNLFKFAYYSNKGLTFNNLNFQHINTTANSIIYLNGLGSSYINDCDFTNCYAQQSHSSIIYLNFGMANVTGCNFKNSNTSFGVITISGWTNPKMNVTGSTFEDNYASVEPGAINNCNNLIVMDSIFKRNTASWWAGAIHTHNNAKTKIYDSTFEDNVAGWNGGALFTYSNLEVYDSTFISNQATGFGGAIGACDNVSHFNITVDNCTFIDNSAYAGGAIGVMDDGNLTVTDSTFKGNSATTGTAIYAVSDEEWGTPHVVIVGNEFYDYDSNTVVYDDVNAVFENNTYPSTASSVQLLGLANPFSNDILEEETPSVIYVKVDGDDSNDGLTADTAVKTIAKAVELSANEGTIIISEGVYAGEEIHFYDKKLTIMGVNCENTIIADGDIKFIRNGLSQGYSFDGFIHLYNITFKNLHVSMDANATVENCIFDNADIICLNSYPVVEVSGEFFIDQKEYIFIDVKHSVFLNHENGNSYFTFGGDAENAIGGINMMIAMGAPMQDMVDQNPLFIVNNCYFNADVLDSDTLISINNCIVPTIVDSDSVVYDGETLNDFTVKLVSVDAEGTVSDFDATGFPSIPVTFTVDGVATESAFVDGVATLSMPLDTDQAVITATVGSKVLTFTLPAIPRINDDNYADYFDEEGNFVYEIEDGATIILGTLTNKNIIFSQPLNIKSNDDSSVITNCTITLTADASGSTITGLKMVLDNVPAGSYPGIAAIALSEGIHDVVLKENSITWVTADSPAYSTAMGIEIIGGDNGVSSNIELIDNEISISGDAPYMYGIDCYSNPWNYEGGAVVDLLAQGNKITLDGSGMVEGIYLSHVTDSVVKNNIIEIESAGGNAYGVGTGNIHDVNMEGNTIVAKATAEGYNATGISLYQSDINEKLNDITVSGSTAQKIGSDAESAIYAIVDNDNYNQYFDESGNYINEAENITLADLSNKDLTFGSPVNVKGAPGAKLNNVTIKLTADASGSTITGLEIVLDNVPAAAYPGLAVITLNEGIQDVVLEGNSIQWVTANSPSGATAMGIAIIGGTNGVSSNIQVNDNEIAISGDASNIYGIDCYSDPWDYDGAIVNLVAQENKITLNGTGFVEGIYLSHVTDSVVKNNIIEIESAGGNAYGVGTDNIHDVTVGGNTISATTTAEGKTAAGISLYQSDIIIDNNIISASGSNTYGIKADNKSAAYIVADGNKYIVVDENNYNQFFDESGNYINNAVDCIALADLSNKDLTFASPISVKGVSGAKLTNVTFTLTAEASDSVIDGLTFDYEGASNVITLNTGIENVAVINNNITFKSTGYYMAAIVAGHYYSGPATSLNISSNNINVTCDNAVYGIDIMGEWGKLVDINSIISDNNIAVQANGMAEGIYLTGVSNCMITNNNIITNIVDTGDSIGIGVDGCNNITISDNVIEATSKQAAFGIANSYNTDNTITNNNVKVAGASAIGIGLGIDTGAVIEGNTIDVTAGDDYATTPTFAGAIGTGNSGIKLANNASADINGNHINSNQNNMDLAGASSNTKVGTNYVKEYIEKEGNPDLPAAPAKTTITVQSATVTADPNGKSKTQNIAITVKDAKGNAVAGQTIQVYVNGALKTAKTNDKGVATLAVPYKAGGTSTLVASFNGATGLLGSSATGKLTVKKNAVKIAAKTKKVKKSKAKKAKVQITVKAGKTALKKKLVTITINKKTYKAKTNAKGIATFKVKLPKKAKKYKYTVKFAGDNFNNAKTFKGKLTVK